MTNSNPTPPLAELQQTILDRVTLSALLDDLEIFTTIYDVVVKDHQKQQVSLTPADLRVASTRLISGEIRGVQIRYRHEGQEWCDTLITGARGELRLVRMAMPNR